MSLVNLFPDIAAGAQAALSIKTLTYSFLGVTLGTLVGILPGVGILAAIAMLMPLTFYLDPLTGLVMLASIYYGATYGGSTTAILLNLPGTPNTAITCLDGHPMAQQGRAGIALFMTTIASFIGSIFGIIMIASFAIPLVNVALNFGTQEYFALMAFGLTAASLITTSSMFKGLSMVTLGIVLGLIGVDVTSGVSRFTMGVPSFFEGLSLVALALGIFGLSDLYRDAGNLKRPSFDTQGFNISSMTPSREDWKRSIAPMGRGAGIGSFFGALPGAGGMIASFMSYSVEKRVSRHPEKFGKGAIEGISGPETANNSAVLTTMIPTLSLGVPGDPISALMLGVLLTHGITPGPEVISNDPVLFWGLIISFLIGNIMLLILNLPLIGLWVKILKVPYSVLFPIIIGFLCIGVYSVNYESTDILVLGAFGLFGFLIQLLKFPVAPLILGFVLGPMLEENFRRSLLVSRGDLLTFFDRPISGTFLVLSVLLIFLIAYQAYRKNKNRVMSHE